LCRYVFQNCHRECQIYDIYAVSHALRLARTCLGTPPSGHL
jgi:hypothetical protein